MNIGRVLSFAAVCLLFSFCVFQLIWIREILRDYQEDLRLSQKIRIVVCHIIGKTMSEDTFHIEGVKERIVQEPVSKEVAFPCNVTDGRSRTVPTSVHRLRPGDVDVIACLGDSLSSGIGILSTNIFHIVIENRGATSAGGGQKSWREYLTLPNIIKEFNPNLIGYATGDSLSLDDASAFNVAEAGAKSTDLPEMARTLIQKMKNHAKVDIKNHWKLITVMIGSNDMCALCHESPEKDIINDYKTNLIETLKIIRDNLPRTLVSLVNTPNLRPYVEATGRHIMGDILTKYMCPCLFEEQYVQYLEDYYRISERWRVIEDEISMYPEFNRDDFTVITQPVSQNSSIPLNADGMTDLTYLAPDTFHVSQKTQARVTNNLWNNLLEPAGNKTTLWTPTFERFLCPTPKRPYISTWYN